MASLEISATLLERLRNIAQRESRPIEAVAETAIEQYVSTLEPDLESQPETSDLFHLLVEASEKHNIHSGRSDVSENFDDIVGNIIAEDFLKRRMESDGDQ